MVSDDLIVGIDLGTTNSEIAAFVEGRVQVLGPGATRMLPSCVGISPSGALLIGESARNQQILYPERTVRSVKRKMGSPETIRLADRTFTPQELSALILRELAEWGTRSLGRPVRKAVITVPAYFSDAQRNATREAGALAGLDVVRIFNEPTAASLAYGHGDGRRRTLMIYDLGGGTFDVSIVTTEKDVTEVLASHGNTQLGGDDFDQLLLERLLAEFQKRHGIDLRQGHRVAYSRLWWAAEEAKKRLSFEPYTVVREEALVVHEGKPLHLEVEITREEYENLIRHLVESTLESVSKALADAGKKPSDLDAIFLVGGSTRTPLVSRLLEERTGLAPRQEVHPDLCVALGAGVLASRLAGHEIDRVLVDVSPYSFGPSYLGEKEEVPYPYCYRPIIRRNTPLPVTRAETYYTAAPYQTDVEVEIFQGEDPDALKNARIGTFRVEGLTPTPEPSDVVVRMSLDVDGILGVTATEKRTGLSKGIKITGALRPRSEKELEAAREKLRSLYTARAEDLEGMFSVVGDEPKEVPQDHVEIAPAPAAAPGLEWDRVSGDAQRLVERSHRVLEGMHEEDREDALGLTERIAIAISRRDPETLSKAVDQLKELLFFVEGK